MKFYEFADKEPKLGKLIVIEGTERFLSDRALAIVLDRLLPPAERDLNLDMIDGSALETFAHVEGALATFPFLAERRVVVVRGTHELKAAPRRALWAIAESAPDGNVLVLEDLQSPTKKSKPETFGQLAGRAATRIDTTADAAVRERFVREQLEALGAKADGAAVSALVDSETDLAGLRTDLEKLALSGKKITIADVAGETLVTEDVKAYQFAGALVAGRCEEALALAFEMFANDPRGAAIPLLAALAAEYRVIWELARPGGEVPARFRWRERALRPIAQRMGERRARAGFERAVRGFEAIVTGRADDPRGIVELVAAAEASALRGREATGARPRGQ